MKRSLFRRWSSSHTLPPLHTHTHFHRLPPCFKPMLLTKRTLRVPRALQAESGTPRRGRRNGWRQATRYFRPGQAARLGEAKLGKCLHQSRAQRSFGGKSPPTLTLNTPQLTASPSHPLPLSPRPLKPATRTTGIFCSGAQPWLGLPALGKNRLRPLAPAHQLRRPLTSPWTVGERIKPVPQRTSYDFRRVWRGSRLTD